MSSSRSVLRPVRKNGAVILSVVVTAAILATFGIVVTLLVTRKKGNATINVSVPPVVPQLVSLAKQSMGPSAAGVDEPTLTRAGAAIRASNVRAGIAPLTVRPVSADQAKKFLASAAASAPSAPAPAPIAPSPVAPSAPVAPIAPGVPLAPLAPTPASTSGYGRQLGAAFQGGMAAPMCGFTQSVDGSGSAATAMPLTAQQMSGFDNALARQAQAAALRETAGNVASTQDALLRTMAAAATNANTAPFAGRLPVEGDVARTAAAIAAVQGTSRLSSGDELAAAAYAEDGPLGVMADGSTQLSKVGQFVGNGGAAGAQGTSLGAALADDAMPITTAMATDDAARHEAAFNLANKVPQTALLGPDASEQYRRNNLSLSQLAKANPELASQILLNAGSPQAPSMQAMQKAWLSSAAGQRSVDANPVFRTWNSMIDESRRAIGRAAPVATEQNLFNMPSTYFDAFRQTQCT